MDSFKKIEQLNSVDEFNFSTIHDLSKLINQPTDHKR